jgi:hypothetical protein
MAVPESFHKGTLPQRKSYLSVDKDNIIMTAFKFCEDGSGHAISCLGEEPLVFLAMIQKKAE